MIDFLFFSAVVLGCSEIIRRRHPSADRSIKVVYAAVMGVFAGGACGLIASFAFGNFIRLAFEPESFGGFSVMGLAVWLAALGAVAGCLYAGRQAYSA